MFGMGKRKNLNLVVTEDAYERLEATADSNWSVEIDAGRYQAGRLDQDGITVTDPEENEPLEDAVEWAVYQLIAPQ